MSVEEIKQESLKDLKTILETAHNECFLKRQNLGQLRVLSDRITFIRTNVVQYSLFYNIMYAVLSFRITFFRSLVSWFIHLAQNKPLPPNIAFPKCLLVPLLTLYHHHGLHPSPVGSGLSRRSIVISCEWLHQRRFASPALAWMLCIPRMFIIVPLGPVLVAQWFACLTIVSVITGPLPDRGRWFL